MIMKEFIFVFHFSVIFTIIINSCYVRYIQNIIEKRLSGYLYNGAPKDHMMEHHNIKISKKELEQIIKYIKIISDIKKYIYMKHW